MSQGVTSPQPVRRSIEHLTSLRTRGGAYHHPPLKGALPRASLIPCCCQGHNRSRVIMFSVPPSRFPYPLP
jgi:hypothetical protein